MRWWLVAVACMGNLIGDINTAKPTMATEWLSKWLCCCCCCANSGQFTDWDWCVDMEWSEISAQGHRIRWQRSNRRALYPTRVCMFVHAGRLNSISADHARRVGFANRSQTHTHTQNHQHKLDILLCARRHAYVLSCFARVRCVCVTQYVEG